MKRFTISRRMQEYEFELLSQKVGWKLPKELFEFLSNYGGSYIEERFLVDINKNKWVLGKISLFTFIYDYIDEVREELTLSNIDLKLIPFAGEEGGWVFCISSEDNYPVYVFKSTNYSGEEAFQKIYLSFDDFIINLSIEKR